MTCKYCGKSIHEVLSDPSIPFVHDENGNAFCDVHNIQDVFAHKWLLVRREATPQDEQEEGYEVTGCYKFSKN